MFFLLIDYESDAERKRIDYAIERWHEKVTIQKPKGTMLLLQGKQEYIDEFIEDVCARLEKSEEKVEVHIVSKYTPKIKKRGTTLLYHTSEKREFIEKFLQYLMTKLNADAESVRKKSQGYKLSTKKGQAHLNVTINQQEKDTCITITITGYGEVVEFIASKIDNEMTMFLGGR